MNLLKYYYIGMYIKINSYEYLLKRSFNVLLFYIIKCLIIFVLYKSNFIIDNFPFIFLTIQILVKKS